MSLKFFHVFFIGAVLVFLTGFGVWAMRRFAETQQADMRIAGIGSFVAVAVLGIYGVWFLKKLKGVSYI